MKQEIICKDSECLETWQHSQKKVLLNPEWNETVKIVSGKSKKIYICDLCGTEINIGEQCYAVSAAKKKGNGSYFAWESEYITEEKEIKADGQS